MQFLNIGVQTVVEISPMIPQKKNFSCFFTIYGHGYVTWAVYTNS